MYQEIWSMSVSTHTDTRTLINYTPLAKAPHPCWTTSTRQPTYDANPGVHVGIKTDVGEEDLVGAVVEQHLVQLQDGWRQLVHLWEPVTRSAQKQALSHIVHKNRHCHMQHTKAGIVTCSTQKQALSQCAQKQAFRLWGSQVSGADTVLWEQSSGSESRFTQAHSPLHLGGGLRVQPFKIKRLQVQIRIQTLTFSPLPCLKVVDYVSSPSRSRGCRFKSEFRHSLSLPCLASRWWTTCPALQDQEAAGSNPNSDTHFLSLALPQGGGLRVQPFKIKKLQVQIQIPLLPLALAVDKASSSPRPRGVGLNQNKTAMFPLALASRWWTKYPALQDWEAAGSNPNSDSHFLSLALPKEGGLSVRSPSAMTN